MAIPLTAPRVELGTEESLTHPAQRRRSHRRSNRAQWIGALLLLVVVFFLAGVLVWVLTRDPGPQIAGEMVFRTGQASIYANRAEAVQI